MIICHCNVICSKRIEAAVSEALQEETLGPVTPASVYEQCRCAPSCGGCHQLIRRIIQDMTAERAGSSGDMPPTRVSMPGQAGALEGQAL